MFLGKEIRLKKMITPHQSKKTQHTDSVQDAIQSKRLFVKDRSSGQQFLIDTGSDISLLPCNGGTNIQSSNFVIYAANNLPIKTFGERQRTLNLGLRRPIVWNFCLASVPYPIIGADLLAAHGINVDLRGRRLIDGLTGLHTSCIDRLV